MRLLDTRTLELSEFNDLPYYAILSHTWGDDEFVFSDFAKPDRRASPGWRKIIRCCELAAADGWEYAWVDTCCIDKSSSAELTEAINSMWKWYQGSQICYVHLADCSISNGLRDLPKSRWFERGWTLQELLAPKRVVFYDADWQELGSRSYLQHDISHICRIDPSHLTKPSVASVATKMSWASRRQTTREEDLAYSLLGLFNINMPLIYGEGSKAFFRLQSEIIRFSTDQSIFAWTTGWGSDSIFETGMLAPSPSCFVDSVDIVPKHFRGFPQTPYQMTNRGLQIEFGCMECSMNFYELFSRNFEMATMEADRSANSLIHLNVSRSKPWYPDLRARFPDSKFWLILLPCVRVTDNEHPIALLIRRSPEGLYARANTDQIRTYKKRIPDDISHSPFESMSFLIANVGLASGNLNRPLSHEKIGRAFIELGPALQQKKRHYAQKLCEGRIFVYYKPHDLSTQVQIDNDYSLLGPQWILEVEFEGGLHLVIVFGCIRKECSVFTAREGKHSQLSPYLNTMDIASTQEMDRTLFLPVGAHIVTLGETDDYTIPYNEEHGVLIRTRRVSYEAHENGTIFYPHGRTRKDLSCAIRLDLCPIPKTEKPDLRS